jgi:hypothetical protein
MRSSSRVHRTIRRPAAIACLAVPLLANQCLPRTKVRLEPLSAPEAPSFTFRTGGEPLGAVQEFNVYACRPSELQTPLWRLRRIGEDSVPAHAPPGQALRITYGQVPPGYTADAPAVPLQPRRCYQAAAAGGGPMASLLPGTTSFYLERDGRVRGVRGEAAFEMETRNEQLYHRATVQCRRGYRRARTPGDSAAVDAREIPVADTSLTCGWMRQEHPDDIREALSSERGTVVFLGFVAAMAALAAGYGALQRAVEPD